MADADVPITAGTGTKIDTRTVGAGTDEHRQVMCVGDPSTAANVAAVSAAGAVKVDGSAVTQPVSLGAAVTIGAGANTIGTVLNVGDVDHDAVNTGKVVQTGGHASPNTTKPTAVATGDRVRQWLDPNGGMVVTPKKIATYRAVFRVVARPYILSWTSPAGGRKQIATIHHAATATKTVRIRGAWFAWNTNPTATVMSLDFIRITAAPATGNPAITPILADSADSAAEATCLALPTTAGTEAATPFSQVYGNLGITGAATTTNPPTMSPWYDLLASAPGVDDERKAPTIRAGVLEGWAITVDTTVASAQSGIAMIDFTEEAP